MTDPPQILVMFLFHMDGEESKLNLEQREEKHQIIQEIQVIIVISVRDSEEGLYLDSS